MAKARVSVIGAHSAVAKAFVECLEERDVEVDLRLATTTERLEGELELVREETIAKCDLAVLAFRGEAARQLADLAARLGKPILDLAEAVAEDPRAVWIFPGVDADAGRAFDPARFSVVPLGVASAIVAALRALSSLEAKPIRASIATYESVASADKPGMDELSDQVRARFNLREVEPRIFESPIAFGCIPRVAASGESAFDGDERMRRAIDDGLERDLPDLDLVVTRVLVPTFSADGAVVTVDLDRAIETGAVRTVLAGARGIHDLGDELPSSFEAIGRDDALLGRLAVEGDRVRFWIACDRLRRGSATLGVLAVERWLAARASPS
jgi:aspartate-semialdehyde dehydrogenase